MSSINLFCNLAEPTTPLTHFREHTVRSDHATLALRAEWQSHLRRCRDELGFSYVRFHGLLSDDVGTLIGHAAVAVEFAPEHASGGVRE